MTTISTTGAEDRLLLLVQGLVRMALARFEACAQRSHPGSHLADALPVATSMAEEALRLELVRIEKPTADRIMALVQSTVARALWRSILGVPTTVRTDMKAAMLLLQHCDPPALLAVILRARHWTTDEIGCVFGSAADVSDLLRTGRRCLKHVASLAGGPQ